MGGINNEMIYVKHNPSKTIGGINKPSHKLGLLRKIILNMGLKIKKFK